jgi:hypothetical protein
VKDTTLYTVTAKSASNNTDVAIFPLTVYALTPNITHAVGQVAITGSAITRITFATVQLAIAPPKLLKVMSLIAEPIVAIWSTAFAILGAAAVLAFL